MATVLVALLPGVRSPSFTSPASSVCVGSVAAAGSPVAASQTGDQVLAVADVAGFSKDEQLLFAALQGIVNRDGPRIYLIGLNGGQDYATDPTAELWLEDAVVSADLQVEQVTDPYRLLERFRARVNGMVVWDPALPIDTQNVATTIAGLSDLLPVSPQLAGVLAEPPYNLLAVQDLRKERFGSRAEAYEWALDELGPAERYGLLAWIGGSRNFTRFGQHGLRDFVVARRGFAFEAEPLTEPLLVRRILDAFPHGTAVYGYPFVDDAVYGTTAGAPAVPDYAPGEPAGVSEISFSGKELVPSTDSTNLTVHSSFAAVAQRPPWDDEPRAPGRQTTYVTFVITDGDNLGWDQQRLRVEHWEDPLRGTIPVGISISPLIATHAPRIYDFYLRTRTENEVFLAGPSGAGYAYPGFHADLEGFLARSDPLMDLAGLRAVWILDYGYAASPSAETVRRYVEALSPSAIFADYGGWTLPNPPSISFSDGVPVVHAAWGESVQNTTWRIRGESFLQRRGGAGPAFVFVALVTSSMGFAEARQVMEQLGPGYQAVRPDHFIGLLKGAYGARGVARASSSVKSSRPSPCEPR